MKTNNFHVLPALLSVLLVLSGMQAYGQQDRYKWRIGLGQGITTYHGDLSYKWVDPNAELIHPFQDPSPWGWHLAVERILRQGLGMAWTLGSGHFVANDRTIDWKGNPRTENPNYGRALNVRTELTHLDWTLKWYMDTDHLLGPRAFLTPVWKLGVSATWFEPSADLYYATEGGGSRPYFYWDDGTIRDQPQDSGTGAIIGQDGIFETKLRPLQTEGVAYQPRALAFVTGLGLKLRLGSRLNLDIQTDVHWTNTDYLDDVAGKFPESWDSEAQKYASNPAGIDGPWRGHPNGKNDRYLYTSASLHFNFARKPRAFHAPEVVLGVLPLAAPPQTVPEAPAVPPQPEPQAVPKPAEPPQPEAPAKPEAPAVTETPAAPAEPAARPAPAEQATTAPQPAPQPAPAKAQPAAPASAQPASTAIDTTTTSQGDTTAQTDAKPARDSTLTQPDTSVAQPDTTQTPSDTITAQPDTTAAAPMAIPQAAEQQRAPAADTTAAVADTLAASLDTLTTDAIAVDTLTTDTHTTTDTLAIDTLRDTRAGITDTTDTPGAASPDSVATAVADTVLMPTDTIEPDTLQVAPDTTLRMRIDTSDMDIQTTKPNEVSLEEKIRKLEAQITQSKALLSRLDEKADPALRQALEEEIKRLEAERDKLKNQQKADKGG